MEIPSMLQQYYEDLKGEYDVFFVALLGTQNCHLKSSQIHALVVVLPDLAHLVLDWDSTGISREAIRTRKRRYRSGSVTIMDVRDFISQCIEQRFQACEALTTSYAVFNPIYEDFFFRLQARKDRLVEADVYTQLSHLVPTCCLDIQIGMTGTRRLSYLREDSRNPSQFTEDAQRAFGREYRTCRDAQRAFGRGYRTYRFLVRRMEGASFAEALDRGQDGPEVVRLLGELEKADAPDREIRREILPIPERLHTLWENYCQEHRPDLPGRQEATDFLLGLTGDLLFTSMAEGRMTKKEEQT